MSISLRSGATDGAVQLNGVDVITIANTGKVSMLTPNISFAAKSSSVGGSGGSGNLIFGSVIDNVGGAYNATTGYFTAPVNGVYTFTATVHGIYGNWAWLQIQKNGVGLVNAQNLVTANIPSATCSIILNLVAGDTVNINSNVYATYGASYNSFSGTLIRTT